jgi:hypothetical protein
MSYSTVSQFRLQVLADADPSAIARVLERFQNINVVPRRVIAEFGVDGSIRVQVDVCGMPEEQIEMVTAKIVQATCVVSAHWHRL